MRKIFGTDGARGIANKDITVELAVNIGRAISTYFRDDAPILIGEDTRISSPMLRNAISAGIVSKGLDAIIAGIIPTPAVSLLTRINNFAAGVVISASHNPIEYNGIKLFSHSGFKLEDSIEEMIENMIESPLFEEPPTGTGIGRIIQDENLKESYINLLVEHFPLNLERLKIAVDCAFGSTFYTTPTILKRLGATTCEIGTTPDGKRINVDCGSTNPNVISQFTVAEGADIGISHDGDGDRVIFSDSEGNIVDGDETMLIIGKYLKKKGKLKNNTVVGTMMSNVGIENAFREEGIIFLRAPVGDRYVLSEMSKSEAILGGEQSGHIIYLNEGTTGDGLITALMILTVMIDEEKPLSKLRKGIVRFPQVLINARVKDKEILNSEHVINFINEEKRRLGKEGRIFIRASGTEPLIRVMVEGENEKDVNNIATKIKEFLEEKPCAE